MSAWPKSSGREPQADEAAVAGADDSDAAAAAATATPSSRPDDPPEPEPSPMPPPVEEALSPTQIIWELQCLDADPCADIDRALFRRLLRAELERHDPAQIGAAILAEIDERANS